MPGRISAPPVTLCPAAGVAPQRMFALLPAVLAATFWGAPAGAASPARAACTTDRTPAGISRKVYAEYPELARLQGVSGMSVIRVDLSPTGDLVSAAVQTSSGSAILDRAALAAAGAAGYAPETRGCRAVAGSYAVQVTFE